MTRTSDAPEARAASTYSRSPNVTKLARTTRAIGGHSTTASVSPTRHGETTFLNAEMEISARSRAGTATNPSTTVEMRRSVHPR